MHSTRRTFVKNGALVATGAAFAKLTPQQLTASSLKDAAGDTNTEWKALIQHALDVVKSTGVSYADIRITFTRDRKIFSSLVKDQEGIHCGIRCLVNGYWGFSSSPVVSKAEMTRLAREAVLQAKANTIGKPRVVELAKAPVVAAGSWTMPVNVDPFDVHPLDGCDLLGGLAAYGANKNFECGNLVIHVVRQDKAFGSTDGSYFTQRVFRSVMGGGIKYQQQYSREFGPYSRGSGWELFEPVGLRTYCDAMVEEMKEDAKLEIKLVDVGRYPMILDAESVAGVLASTVGLATELDRALGYEANATGTSYLNEPDEMVGTQKIGTPLLSVTGNRNEPGGLATVQWDDDGVAPESFELVRDGVLQRFQTTRESAQWMQPTAAGGAGKSTGGAYAATGVDAPITRSPNLVMAPADNATTLSDLYRDVKRGVMFRGMRSQMDFQQLNGFGKGPTDGCYEITNGKRSAILLNAGALFRAPELWKSLLSVGGKQTVCGYGLANRKGQPAQEAYHTVSAAPALFENGTIIDFTRKA